MLKFRTVAMDFQQILSGPEGSSSQLRFSCADSIPKWSWLVFFEFVTGWSNAGARPNS